MKTKKVTARARPGRPRSEEKRDAILSAAGSLFLENGLDRTSMDAVAQRAGVSKQTVYSHFAGKEDLLTACVGNKLETYDVAAANHIGRGPMRETLVQLAERFLSLIHDEAVVQMYRVIIGSVQAHPELAQLFFEAGPMRAMGTFRQVLAHHAEVGELAIDDLDQAVDMLLGMLTGGPHMRSILGVARPQDEAERRACAERCVDGFLRMFAVA